MELIQSAGSLVNLQRSRDGIDPISWLPGQSTIYRGHVIELIQSAGSLVNLHSAEVTRLN